jgi:para-nitrobenzyl esterase
MQRFVQVATSDGVLRGVEHRGITSFLGVPYGGSTAGSRFRPPPPVTPWSGVRDALSYGHAAPQLDSRVAATAEWIDVLNLMYPRTGSPVEGLPMSEDCLVLNVWTPAADPAANLPVMVWFHGGGFAVGSGAEGLFQGAELAQLGEVVVVTVNHRLGILGYLPLDLLDESFEHSGVAGMLDIVQALEWVRANIAGFGGDPGNVTIFGQSGGGSKVSALLQMPPAAGLFHRAIVQSGVVVVPRPEDETRALAEDAVMVAGLTVGSARELAEFPLERLMAVQAGIRGGPPSPFAVGEAEDGVGLMAFSPTYDREMFPVDGSTPLSAMELSTPVLVGFASHDASLLMCADPAYATCTDDLLRERLRVTHGEGADQTFDRLLRDHPDESPRLRFARAVTESTFQTAAIGFAERHASGGAPVYAYELAYRTPVLDDLLGATHSLDLPLVFHTVSSSPFSGERADRHTVSRDMALAWAAFARSGDPNHAGIPHWEPYAADGRATMRIDTDWEPFAGVSADEIGRPASVMWGS